MKKSFSFFAYILLVIVGAWMFAITADGRIIKICIACTSVFQKILGIISMIIGVVGLIGNNALTSNAER